MNAISRLRDYLRGAIAELRKVTWPSKKQTTNYSIVVIALTIGVALFFGFSDYILNLLLGIVIK